MMARAGAVVVTGLVILAVVYGWDNIRLIRGTVLWDVRYVAFTVAVALVFTVAERLAALFSRLNR